jgi:hypothetical protein
MKYSQMKPLLIKYFWEYSHEINYLFNHLIPPLIFNTAPREHSGQHWFAYYYDQNGKCNFFDPYGMPAVNFNMTSYLKKLQIIGKRIKSVCRVSLIIVDIIVFYIYFLALVLKEPFFSQLYLIAHKK